MPEGPEIRLAADRVAKAVVGRPLTQVWFAFPELRASAEILSQSKVTQVTTVGKAMLTHFECGLTVYSHNQLYGRWYVVGVGKEPRTQRQLRWALRTETGSALLYSASDISVWSTAQIAEHPFVAKAGIDVLATPPSAPEMEAYLKNSPSQRRSLGSLLLDQSFVAGVGNYLRSEILFEARLSPERKLGALNEQETRALAQAIVLMIHRAYQTRGVTNSPERVKTLKAQGLRRNAYRHYVFARRDARCYVCDGNIEQKDVAGRRLYWCPRCQAH